MWIFFRLKIFRTLHIIWIFRIGISVTFYLYLSFYPSSSSLFFCFRSISTCLPKLKAINYFQIVNFFNYTDFPWSYLYYASHRLHFFSSFLFFFTLFFRINLLLVFSSSIASATHRHLITVPVFVVQPHFYVFVLLFNGDGYIIIQESNHWISVMLPDGFSAIQLEEESSSIQGVYLDFGLLFRLFRYLLHCVGMNSRLDTDCGSIWFNVSPTRIRRNGLVNLFSVYKGVSFPKLENINYFQAVNFDI